MSHAKEKWPGPPNQRNEPQQQPERAMMQSPGGGAGFSVPLHAATSAAEERIEVPGGSDVHVNDVLCGRGKVSFNHSGNKRFRQAITNSLDDYRKACAAGSRSDKASIVQRIINNVQNTGGRFLKENQATGEWYPLTEQQTKEKVSHAVRDAANTMDARKAQRASKAAKKMAEHKDDSSPLGLGLRTSLSSAAIGSANFYENLDRATREIRRHASQQNYFPYSTMEQSSYRGSGMRGFAEERLPIRTMRDIQIPGDQHHPAQGVPLRSAPAIPNVYSSGFAQQAGPSHLHTNFSSEPRMIRGPVPPLVGRPSTTGGAILMPEGPRLGFASFQASTGPQNPSPNPAPQRAPSDEQPLDIQPSDDSDNFLERINDVLGPMPDEGDQT